MFSNRSNRFQELFNLYRSYLIAKHEEEKKEEQHQQQQKKITKNLTTSVEFETKIKDENTLFQTACEQGRIDLVSVFLKNSKVDPRESHHRAFFIAIENNQYQIVELLLKDPRIDPGYLFNEGFMIACSKNYIDIIRLLIEHPKVDPQDGQNRALLKAITNNYSEIVTLLLQSPRIDPSIPNYEPLSKIITLGREEMLKQFLQHEKINLENCPFSIIEKSIYNYKILNILLQDSKFDPSQENNKLLYLAIKNMQVKSINLLLQHQGKIKVKVTPNVLNAFTDTDNLLDYQNNYYKSRLFKRLLQYQFPQLDYAEFAKRHQIPWVSPLKDEHDKFWDTPQPVTNYANNISPQLNILIKKEEDDKTKLKYQNELNKKKKEVYLFFKNNTHKLFELAQKEVDEIQNQTKS